MLCDFLLRGQKKVTKEKATRMTRISCAPRRWPGGRPTAQSMCRRTPRGIPAAPRWAHGQAPCGARAGHHGKKVVSTAGVVIVLLERAEHRCRPREQPVRGAPRMARAEHRHTEVPLLSPRGQICAQGTSHCEARSWSVILFGFFLLDKQEKETRGAGAGGPATAG